MYLVLDIGGTWTKFGYYKKDGQLLVKDKYPTITTTLDDFYDSIEPLIINKGVEGIAISMPGLLDATSGMIEAITLLPFLANHNIIEDLQKRYHIPVSVENDAKCAALGEMWQGSLHGVKNGVMMVIGSGIGATIILDGKIYKGSRNKAGEIGSVLMPLDTSYNVMTNFGRNNSANALFTKINTALDTHQKGEDIFKEVLNNAISKDLFVTYCRQIAFMIYNLDYILDLDVVSIGGGISEQPLFIETVQEQFREIRKAYKEDNHEPNIRVSKFHNDANLLGALYYYLMRYENGLKSIC